jgi:molybdopterin molybdotransferase
LERNIPVERARDNVLARITAVGPETVKLEDACGRVLYEDVYAAADIPKFDRSPYDGYAFIAEDSAAASRDNPVTLNISEAIYAGDVPAKPVARGNAAKIMTGAPIPAGADTVVKFETTEFTGETVTIFAPSTRPDIVRAGEDVKAGALIARKGTRIDAALAASLAAQGFSEINVFKRPRAGIISIGNELTAVGEALERGKIYDSNRYSIAGACESYAEAVYLGSARDDLDEIAARIAQGFETCDVLFATGGAAVGDRDVTLDALKKSGAEVLVNKLKLKPGSACAYGVKDGKPVFCLSGNPASSMTNFYAVALPCLRKISGLREYKNREILVSLNGGYDKKGKEPRLIRGKLDLSDGTVRMHLAGQGNVRISTLIGCDVIAIIPENTQSVPDGAALRGFLLDS